MSNVKIAVCNFTIACWIRLFQPSSGSDHVHTITTGSSISGEFLILFIRTFDRKLRIFINREVSVNTTLQASVTFTAGIHSWIHIAVTCDEDNKVRMYVNGELFKSEYTDFDLPSQNMAYPPIYRIGNSAGQSLQMIGSIADLYIIGFALPPDDVSDLFRGWSMN